MSNRSSTPGVHIEDKNAFNNSVVPVATAVPVFIGFTERAIREQQTLSGQLFKIATFEEFNRHFGGPPKTTYAIEVSDSEDPFKVTPTKGTQYYLYYSLKLYFNNGGSDCYIYSAGGYTKDDDAKAPNKLTAEMVDAALKLLEGEQEPTIVVIPDGHTMEEASDYYSLFQKVLPHCREMVNRFAILDVHGGGDPTNLVDSAATSKLIDGLRNGVGLSDLNFGAAYWPWIQSSVVQPSELDYLNVEDIPALGKIIMEEAELKFTDPNDPNLKTIQTIVARLTNERATAIGNLSSENPTEEAIAAEMKAVIARDHNALVQASGNYKEIMKRIRETANIMPPSGAMAGAYKATDSSIGSHHAPANISLISVSKPMVQIDNQEQESLNIPIDGKAINAIRAFPGKGVLVWGARTMDGNSLDWRYISVRRTVSMIELSIRNATETFVFQPNNSNTWLNLKSMITSFLTNMWYAGALAGATPESAFSVDVGLGSTMTPVDVLDGFMRVSVKIAVTRPGEFIVITFEQQMQTA